MSHRLYDPNSSRRTDKAVSTRLPDKAKATEDICRDGVDGLPRLPIDDPLNPELRVLFHHFFDSVFDRLAGIFRGPLLEPGYKDRMLGIALQDKAYCMGLITQAQTDMAISTGVFTETRESLELYTKLISIFRNQLAASTSRGPPNPLHIELALLVLCILLSYNVTRGRFSELNMNWAAMRQLVNLRGGVHNLTVALAYVVHVDRLGATMLGSQPTYVTHSARLHRFSRPPWGTYSPGFVRLEQFQRHLITRPVLEHCLNTCELLALYEAFHQPALPAPTTRQGTSTRPPPPSSSEYLYYLRDRVDEEFTLLYCSMLKQNTPSKCVLMAVRIVEYPVTWANYVPSLIVDLCTELCTLLRKQDLFECWFGASDLLGWILFVLLTSQWPFAGRDWALNNLRGIIGAKYGSAQWPENWWEEELTSVKSFAWSDARFLPKFRQVCRELQTGTHHQSPWQEHKQAKIEPVDEP
ncbi:hypothetical protein HRR90_002225 [Exophiala dermatitidis]|nr:hypothetical protein HRR73_004017 [Exophiala dermatitidis]KAJ4533930.1 hypothetical protein HRR76_005881 [Exophiala dermatitidis]KAJ4550087.1 hypothetical protein HRR77_003567 [Exophiala dermatitidis]KAJ4577674.1 hypothetical protein HRR79_001011 [Exophiala dermatitidis]KAJ4657561.1 hypothetical protein HRR90_002225 [Exophiala dermatitidis]